jgi:hypothetical protein
MKRTIEHLQHPVGRQRRSDAGAGSHNHSGR